MRSVTVTSAEVMLLPSSRNSGTASPGETDTALTSGRRRRRSSPPRSSP